MPINIVEGAWSDTGLNLDLGAISVASGVSGDSYTVGNALDDLVMQNAGNADFLPEYITFQTEGVIETRFTAMGTIDGVGSAWRLRLETDSFDGNRFATVQLDGYNDGTAPFRHVIIEGYDMFALSEVIGTHIFSYPDPADPENNTLTQNKAVGVQDALVSTPNTISAIDNYIAFGSNNDDVITGTSNIDRLVGRNGNDTLLGGVGNARDILSGGMGDDLLRGQGGRDALRGREGSDIMFGNSGADQFIYSYAEALDADLTANDGDEATPPSVDEIRDFSSADGDVIELRDFTDVEEGIFYTPEVYNFPSRFSAEIYDFVFRNTDTRGQLYVRTDTTGTNDDFTLVAKVNTTLSLGDFVTPTGASSPASFDDIFNF